MQYWSLTVSDDLFKDLLGIGRKLVRAHAVSPITERSTLNRAWRDMARLLTEDEIIASAAAKALCTEARLLETLGDDLDTKDTGRSGSHRIVVTYGEAVRTAANTYARARRLAAGDVKHSLFLTVLRAHRNDDPSMMDAAATAPRRDEMLQQALDHDQTCRPIPDHLVRCLTLDLLGVPSETPPPGETLELARRIVRAVLQANSSDRPGLRDDVLRLFIDPE